LSQRRIKRPLTQQEKLRKLAGKLQNQDELETVVFHSGRRMQVDKEVYKMIRPYLLFTPSQELEEWASS